MFHIFTHYSQTGDHTMNFAEFRKHDLKIGTRGKHIQLAKQKLSTSTNIQFRNDGTDIYTSELQYLAFKNKKISNLLRGGILANICAFSQLKSSSQKFQALTNETNISPITINGIYWVDFTFDHQVIKRYVSQQTTDILNSSAGALATNVVRAISAVNALNSYPTQSTSSGHQLSVTFQGTASISGGKKGAPEVGGSASVGGQYSYSWGTVKESTDGIMRDLMRVNGDIRTETARIIGEHRLAVSKSDTENIVMERLDEIPSDNAKNLALDLTTCAARLANKNAHEFYEKYSPNGDIPLEFKNYFMMYGIKVF